MAPRSFSGTILRAGNKNTITYPAIGFTGWHPDLEYVYSNDKTVAPFDADYSSSLIFYGFMKGLTEAQTLALFNGDMFERLGFYSAWDISRDFLLNHFAESGMPLDGVFDRWAVEGPFMHSFNHPKLRVVKHVAEKLVEKIGLEKTSGDPLLYISDALMHGPVWPIYPPIADRRGGTGSYCFKLGDRTAEIFEISPYVGLEQMISVSYAEYSKYDRQTLKCDRVSHYDDLLSQARPAAPASRPPLPASQEKKSSLHPYKDLPPSSFWNRSFQGDPSQFDPVNQVPFRIGTGDKVATAGSCFAQHISARLKSADRGFLITEPGPEARNFGVFSARYGNIYTARQLAQLLDRAFGRMDIKNAIWEMPSGRFADAFRPQIEPDGFESEEAVLADRDLHLAAVRAMFEQANVFIFTLGLTEGWRSLDTGAVYPLAPGVVAGGERAIAGCAFVNFTTEEVQADLAAFIKHLRQINPEVKIILTVSPVPLAATYEPQHVLLSSTYSKSVLRAAAETTARTQSDVFYFPSYEVITGSYNRGAYYDETLRNVTPQGVDHVMKLFFRHMVEGLSDEAAERARAQLTTVSRILCDEERLAL
jgi:hypothetical protein